LINPGAVNTRRTPYPELFLLGVFKKAVGVRGRWPAGSSACQKT